VYDVANISDYAHKTISWGKASWEDALFLPKHVSEVRDQLEMESPDVRREKDLVAAFNFSEELARAITFRRRIDP
jgi:hypothetical protein